MLRSRLLVRLCVLSDFKARARWLYSSGVYLAKKETAESSDDESYEMPKAVGSHESPSFLHDPLAMKFINCMMWDGKKSLSLRIFNEALHSLKRIQFSSPVAEKETVDPLVMFHQALENAKPLIGTIGIKKGGRTYQVPVPLQQKRQQFLAIKWLITAARERKGLGMGKKLAAEIMDAYNNDGTVIKRKQDLHRLAEANRTFAHFRW